MKITIIIADDHKVICEGLRSLLEKQKDMEVVAVAADGREAVELAEKRKPQVLLMDIGMPRLNGIEATRRIKQSNPSIAVIALSMYSDKRFLIEMFNAGASGYVPKDSAFEEVVRAIHTVVEGNIYLSPHLAGPMVKEFVQLNQVSLAAAMPSGPLTSREREILQLIAEGQSTKQIALFLKVSIKTVEAHRSHIMDKLDIRSIPELTKYAIREGITSLNS